MKLSGKQNEELQKAMLSAFQELQPLQQMLKFRLEKHLPEFSSSSNSQSKIIFDLIEKAECEGWLQELVNKAHEYNPGNPELKLFVQSFKEENARPDIPCPYRGLSAFREEDKDLFFGREKFVQQLVEAVKEHPLVPVIGSSGSGKSSVVLAGLIPRLRAEGTWLIESFRPNKQPFYELAAAIISQLEPELGKTDKTIKVKKLAKSIRQDGFTGDVSAILKDKPGKRLLLVVDQFEELYTGCADIEQQQFMDALLAAVELPSSAVRLVLTLRADFYSYLVNYPPFGKALNNHPAKNLLRMTKEEQQEVIERPAEKMGVKLEEKLTQQILNDVKQEPGNLPLLEFALEQLWNKQSGGLLTHQAYSKIGRVAEALRNHAKAVYGKLSKEEQTQAKRIFLHLVRPGEGTEDTRRVATRGDVGEECWELIARMNGLADERLVVTGGNKATGEETVEVVHEALIREWEELQGWIDYDRTFLTWRDLLRISIAQWNKGEASLLRDQPLVTAEDWLQKRPKDLIKEREYIQQSLDSQQREKDQKKHDELEKLKVQAKLDTEQENSQILASANNKLTDANQEAEQKIRYGNVYLAVSIVVAVLFLGSAAIAIHKQIEAQKSTQLELQSNSVITQFPNNQIQALVKAMQIGKELERNVNGRQIKDYPTIRPISALQEILYNIHEQNEFNTGHEIVTSISFSPDSQSIATVGKDGKLRLWNLSGQIIKEIQAHDGKISGANSVTFSPDGKRIATSGEDQKVKFFDAVSGELSKTLSEKESGIKSASFSPDGKKIATSGYYGIARIWDLSGKQLPITLKGYKESDKINNITFSPDNKTIATAGDDGTVRLWDLSGKQLFQIIPHKGKRVFSVRFSPDGKLLATAGEDNTPRIWNLSGQEQRKLKGHDKIVTFVSFSPDGKRLATTSEDGTARVWDAASGNEIYKFKGHERTVLTASFSPDGKYLATAGKDGKTRIWNLSDQQKNQTTQFKGHQSDVNTQSISPDGTRMASGDNNGFVRLWDLSTNKQIGKEFKADNRGRVLSITFSPDSKFLISGGEDGISKIWDLSGQLIRQLKEKQGNSFISSLSFSSDGKYIAITGANQTPKIWSWDGEKIAKKIATLEGHQGLVYQVSFHPKQKLIATAAWDGTIGLWKWSDNQVKKIKIWPGHQGKIRSLSFSSDGKYLATGDDNSELKVWNLSGQEKLKLFSYQREIQAVAFSSDGKYIATGGKDGTVKLWDWLGRQVFEFKIEKGSVWDISFSSDGRSIVAGGDSGQLQSWPVKDLDQLLAEGCDWLKGYLENSGQAKDKLEVCRNKDSNPK